MAQPTLMDQLHGLSVDMLSRINNANTRCMYRKGLTDFLTWWKSHRDIPFDRTLVQAYVSHLTESAYSPATINQRLAAIRKLIGEAAERHLLDFSISSRLIRIEGVRRRPVRRHRSLNAAQTEALINAPEPSCSKGRRDRALLALLVGCALRRNEVVQIVVEDIQQRGGRWVLIDVPGSRGRSRTVALPSWVKIAVDAWLRSADLREGPIFRAVDRKGSMTNHAISAQGVLSIVGAYGRSIGLEVKPEDLRRTCARLCHAEGGELEQIQMLLGHASVQTTVRYLGAKQNLMQAPNDRLRLRWHDRQKLAS
jgi:integrase/recombinase XerD